MAIFRWTKGAIGDDEKGKGNRKGFKKVNILKGEDLI